MPSLWRSNWWVPPKHLILPRNDRSACRWLFVATALHTILASEGNWRLQGWWHSNKLIRGRLRLVGEGHCHRGRSWWKLTCDVLRSREVWRKVLLLLCRRYARVVQLALVEIPEPWVHDAGALLECALESADVLWLSRLCGLIQATDIQVAEHLLHVCPSNQVSVRIEILLLRESLIKSSCEAWPWSSTWHTRPEVLPCSWLTVEVGGRWEPVLHSESITHSLSKLVVTIEHLCLI